jgi:hypothetical protein
MEGDWTSSRVTKNAYDQLRHRALPEILAQQIGVNGVGAAKIQLVVEGALRLFRRMPEEKQPLRGVQSLNFQPEESVFFCIEAPLCLENSLTVQCFDDAER